MTKQHHTNIDTLTLGVEDDVSPNHGTGVMVLAAPLDYERLKRTIEARLLCFARFRQRVVEPVLPWRPPSWQDDRDFDLRYHLQKVSVRAYSQSKLALALLCYEFARRLGGTGITVNVLDPGFVATGIISGNRGWVWALFQSLANLVAVSPAQGAQACLYLASSPDVAVATGQYFTRGSPVSASPAACGPVAALRLWQICLNMTGETASA